MNSTTTRRSFLGQGSAIAGLGLRHLSRGAFAVPGFGAAPQDAGPRGPARRVDSALRIDTDPLVKTLALRAVEAAKAAGASYADARLTRTLSRLTGDNEELSLGVRALVNGTWGFASSPYWEPEEAVSLARDAVAQAKANSAATTRPVDLGQPVVTTGSWVMPVKVDPFTVPMEEVRDVLGAWRDLARRFGRDAGRGRRVKALSSYYFVRQERAVASTEGSYFTQTTWRSDVEFTLYVYYALDHTPRWSGEGNGEAHASGLGYQTAGWDMLLDARVDEQFPRLLEEAAREAVKQPPPGIPGDVGRYDAVFDAVTMASLVEGSLGGPTQLDRALGYEANATGTSYVTDPLGTVGRFQIGAPLLSLAADRSAPGGLATVKWDDEGVETGAFPLVEDGVLVDFQTTREMATWLKEYYAKRGQPVRSRGCCAAATAADFPVAHTPNLTMQPGKESISFDDLVKDTERGIAVTNETFGFDWQGLSGMGGSLFRKIYEIRNGRLGRRLQVVVPMFNSIELWKSLQAIGGPGSGGMLAMSAKKGQPEQSSWHTVGVVPAKFTNVAFIDPNRKA